jgi:hypothetical protein
VHAELKAQNRRPSGEIEYPVPVDDAPVPEVAAPLPEVVAPVSFVSFDEQLAAIAAKPTPTNTAKRSRRTLEAYRVRGRSTMTARRTMRVSFGRSAL